jgi:predicted O-methyltransferase YrrM
MNPVLTEILRTRRVKSDRGFEHELNSEVSLEEGQRLQAAIRQCNATTTLEVGLCYGISTLFICQELADKPGARHIVMDPNQTRDFDRIGLSNLERAGYQHLLDFDERSSHVVLPQLESQGVQIDFAFVDGSHLFDYTLLEFFYLDRLLRVGGIIAFDDVFMPAVQKVCRFILANRQYTIFDCLPQGIGWRQNLKYELLNRACRVLPPLERFLKPEFQPLDIDLRPLSNARYLALKKEGIDSEETRSWNFYRDF